MKPITIIICSTLAVLWNAASADAQPGPAPRALSFADTEREALANHVEARIAVGGVKAAEYGLKSGRSLRLPKVTLESNLLVWNDSIAFDLAIPGMMLPPDQAPESVVVRGRVTSTTTLSVGLPLLDQLVISDVIGIRENEVSAAKLELQGARMNVAYRAADAYISVLLAQSARDIATARVTQLEAQSARAKILVEGGVLQQVDLLRLEAALSAARAEVINSEANVRLAVGVLVLAIGLPPGTQLTVADDFPESPAPPTQGANDAAKLAESQRSELGVLRVRAEQAEHAARAEKLRLLPSLVAVASLQHNEGGGTFANDNAWFAGVTLSWDAWDWLGQWNKHKEAQARAEQASLAQMQARDGIRVEVAVTVSNAAAAHKLLAVTQTGVDAAQEAYRIQKDRFDEGAATTTDILDADAELAQAKLAYSVARYSYFRALVTLAKATAQLPTAVVAGRQGNR